MKLFASVINGYNTGTENLNLLSLFLEIILSALCFLVEAEISWEADVSTISAKEEC